MNPYFHPVPGGTEHVLYELYKRLAKMHNVTILTSSPQHGRKEYIEEIEGMRVVRLNTIYHNIPGLPLPLAEMRRLNDHIKSIGADIYHLNNRYQYFPSTIKAIKKTNKKFAMTIHNALPKGIDVHTDTIGYLYDVVWGREVMRSADLITAVSQSALGSTVPKSERYKSCIIFNGVDQDAFMPRRKTHGDVSKVYEAIGLEGNIVLNCARLVTQKGQIYLLRAIAGLYKNEKEDVSLMIIGKGPIYKKLAREAYRLGIEKRFRILSNIPDKTLPYYYNSADIYAMPSLYEPASVALLEGMASALPTITTNIGGFPEIGKDSVLYTSVKSHEGIKAAIRQILGDKKSAMKMAESGRELVREEHDWDSIARQYEERFESITRN